LRLVYQAMSSRNTKYPQIHARIRAGDIQRLKVARRKIAITERNFDWKSSLKARTLSPGCP
jgi:hypothetical protein